MAAFYVPTVLALPGSRLTQAPDRRWVWCGSPGSVDETPTVDDAAAERADDAAREIPGSDAVSAS
jgi:hypothetical protein